MNTDTQWEYKTVTFQADTGVFSNRLDPVALNQRLNELGEQRWELVSIFSTSYYGSSRVVIAVFKRPAK